MKVCMDLSSDELRTLHRLTGYDITIPDALRKDGAGEPFVAEVEDLLDKFRKTLDRADDSFKAQFGVPLF